MVLVPPPIDPGQLTQCRRFEVPTPPAANSVRNFKLKSGTRIIELLVPLCFRSSCQSMLRRITNFGNWGTSPLALVSRNAMARYYDGPVSDHFDGTRFFDPHGEQPRSVMELIRWRLTGTRASWPERS